MTEMYAVFRGIVQGVGFRYTAVRVARKYNLTGWVRNRLDGSVEMIVQGNKPDILKMLEDLKTQFEGYIRSSEVEYRDPQEIFTDFSVRF